MTTPAAITETHISVVFFVGDRAYKLKKPVAPGFLDFSTRELREAACHREVDLNRRLAPDVYLGVADVMGPDGAACDHLVVMRRLPVDRRLSALVISGMDVNDHLRELARLLAKFHAAAPRSAEISEAATPRAIARRWERNFTEMHGFVDGMLDRDTFERVEHLARRYLEGRGGLLERRVHDDRVVDGHGDLLADDIFCLDDGPRVIDCIEFDDGLRYNDVLGDVAFLAMDLDRLGAADRADRFLDDYREFADETWPASLADHYVAERALVRSKVACLRAEQGDPASEEQARQLVDLACRHLERGRIRLALVGGLPGTGKSTLATGISDARAWPSLRSDEVRKDQAGLAHTEPAAAGYREGLYSGEHTVATYRELLGRARTALALGECVVVDASWTDARWRSAAHAVAAETSSDLIELHCVAPRAVAAGRIASRLRAGGDASDAAPEIAAQMGATADPWPTATAIDTADTPERSLDAALRFLADDEGRTTGPGGTSDPGDGRACG